MSRVDVRTVADRSQTRWRVGRHPSLGPVARGVHRVVRAVSEAGPGALQVAVGANVPCAIDERSWCVERRVRSETYAGGQKATVDVRVCSTIVSRHVGHATDAARLAAVLLAQVDVA